MIKPISFWFTMVIWHLASAYPCTNNHSYYTML